MKYKFLSKMKLAVLIFSVMIICFVFYRHYLQICWGSNLPSIGSVVEEKLSLSEIIPEYNRSLGKIVISLSKKYNSLKLHHEILRNLPEYTEIFLLTPSSQLDQIQKEAQHLPYGNRLNLIPYESSQMTVAETSFYLLFPEKEKLQSGDTKSKYSQLGSIWTQDLFEVIQSPTGNPIILVSDVHKYYYSSKGKYTQTYRDNSYISSLSSVGIDVQLVPLAFMGGNILVDEFEGEKVIFCGGDVFKKTRTVWKAFYDSNISDSQIKKLIKKIFNANSVVVFSSDSIQPRLMFHLDQAMLFLPDGNVCIARIVKSNIKNKSDMDEIRDVEIFLTKVREKLQKIGYQILDIEMSEQNLLHFQHYINAIPYTDAVTGNKKILMPVFLSNQPDLDRKLIDDNINTLEAAGYQVIQVPTEVNEINGGIHCMVNVLE